MTPSEWTAGILERGQALHEVEAEIAAARARGTAAVVRITGPPGIGKTTFLLYVLRERQREPRALLARAEPAMRARPGAALEALLREVPENAARGREPREALDAAASQGALIAIDDAQWLDEASERFVRELTRRHGDKVTVLLADRGESAPRLGPHATVRLRPLARAGAAALVRRLYPAAAPDVVDEIVAAAAGLPFSLEFLAASAAARAAFVPEQVGASPAAVIAERLDRCSPRARDVVLHCAFLDAPADLRHVARAIGLSVEAAADALAELADLVTVDGELHARFRHAFIAEACASLPASRALYHRRLLDAFAETDDRTETLAAKLHAARGCGDDAAAAACALALGRRFSANGSLLTALEHVELALRHAVRPLPAAYAVEYASVLMLLARDGDAAAFLTAEVRGAIARRDGKAIAELMTAYASVSISLERFVEFDALFERVEPLIARDRESLPMLLTARLAVLTFSGRIGEAESFAATFALRWADRRALAFTAALAGEDRLAEDRFEEYRAGLGVAHERLERGDRALIATIRLHAMGTAALREIDEHWGDERDPGTYPTGTALRILQRTADGRWDEAGQIVRRLPLDDIVKDEPYALLDARLLYAATARRAPHAPEHALLAIRTMIANGRRRHAIAPAAWLWIAQARAGEPVPADVMQFVSENIDAEPMPYLFGRIPLYLAWLGSELGAGRCAAALARRAPAASRWDRAHAALAHGLLANDAAALRSARDAFDALGARAFAMIAGVALPIPRAADVALAEALDTSGGDGDTSPRASGSGKLTPREREIGELAAQGLSNRAIAARTGLKERTVETHLTAAFRKLGVRSRGGLAHALLRLVGRSS